MKKLLLVLTACLMTVCLSFVVVSADDTSVARIGEAEYFTLQSAIDAAEAGETIVLIGDVTESISIGNDKNITIDLNGYRISNSGESDTITNSGTVKIISTENSETERYTGEIFNNQENCASVRNSGSLEVIAGDTLANGFAMVNTGTIELKGYAYVWGQNTINPAILNNKDASLTISSENATIEAFEDSDGQADTLYGCCIENLGHVNMISGSINGNVSNSNTASITIRDCRINGNFTADQDANVKITGGKFTIDINSFLDDLHTADAVELEKYSADYYFFWGHDYIYVVSGKEPVAAKGEDEYYTLQSAIDAAEDGETIVLLQETTENIYIANDKDITIDFHGYWICNDGESDTLVNKGVVKFVSSDDSNSGGVVNNFDNCVTVRNSGTMEIADGTIERYGIGGSAIVNTGTLELGSGARAEFQSEVLDSPAIVNNKHALLTISGAYIVSVKPADRPQDAVYGSGIENSGRIKMTEGAIRGDVSNSSTATITVSGGDISGYFTVHQNTNVAITGGRFSTNIDSFLDNHHVADDVWDLNDDDKDFFGSHCYVVREGERPSCTVTVKSIADDTYEEFADVTGGGIYRQGQEATVQAKPVPGYVLKGWARASDSSMGFDSSIYFSNDYDYTFTVTEDIDLVAVYTPADTNTYVQLKVHGAGFTVNNGPVQRIYNYTQGFNLNSVVTLNAVDDGFLYWMNKSNKIVSTDPEYTFLILRDTELTAVYKNAYTDAAFVEFVSDYGQVIQAQNYDAESLIDFPPGPSKSGAIFSNWSETQESIIEKISQGETYIRVTPVYIDDDSTFTIRVWREGPDLDELAFEEEHPGFDFYNVTAENLEGRGLKFSHWLVAGRGDKQILSTSETYSCYLNGDISLTAVYVDSSEEVESKPAIAIMDGYQYNGADGGRKVEFTVLRDVPEGYTVLQNGIVYSTDTYYMEQDEYTDKRLVITNEKVTTILSAKNDRKGVYIHTFNVGLVTENIFIRGYMTVRNDETKVIKTIYTPIKREELNSPK